MELLVIGLVAGLAVGFVFGKNTKPSVVSLQADELLDAINKLSRAVTTLSKRETVDLSEKLSIIAQILSRAYPPK
jgi:hypothetical protein